MILWSSFVHEKRTSALSSPREMVDASKNFKTWNLKRGVRYSKSGIPWPFVDRSIRREFFEGEIDDVFAAKGGGFLASYLATLSFSLSFTMPVHYVTPEWCTRDLSSWVTVKIFVEGLHRRKVMNLVPLWGIWVTRDRFLRIYTHFFFFFYFFSFYWKSWGGNASIVIRFYRWLQLFEYDFVQGKNILHKLRWVHGFE